MKTYELQPTDNPELARIVDAKGDWTHYWDIPNKRAVRAVNFILDRGYAKGPQFYEALKNSTPDQWDKKMHYAQDKGDAIHQSIKQGLVTGKFSFSDKVLAEDNTTLRNLTREEWGSILSFTRLWNDHGMILIEHERAVINREDLGYAGTLDLIAIMTKACESRYCKCELLVGKVGLWDHKSGKGIYPNYGPQVAAYSTSNLSHLEKLEGRKIQYTAIDHLGRGTERGYKIDFYNNEETFTHLLEFLAADQIMRNEYKPFDLEVENEEIPEEAALIVSVLAVAAEPVAKPQTKSKKPAKGIKVAKPKSTSK